MKKEIADRWVAALRSGQYKQGKNMLRGKDDSFCCLGVLCNLHAQDHPWVAAKEHDARSYLKEEYTLPKEVQEWADINGSNPVAEGLSDEMWAAQITYCTLAEANDAGESFDAIANFIGKNWKKL